jgi:hypothetical protein
LAFVRPKNVRGYTYYQFVRNDRVEGKHRQEVLAHLGPHDSLEAAILDEDSKVASDLAHYDRRISFYLNEAETIWRQAKRIYQSDYQKAGQVVELLDPDEAYSRRQQYEKARRSGDSEEEGWDRVFDSPELVLIMRSIQHHKAKEAAAYYEKLASDCQARLDRLLRLMNEYPQPIRSSRTFDLLRRKEAQTP